MSSHREAPEISKDPVADNTDLYAFVSPDRPDTVTLIANFIPLQSPDGGPNFYEFGDDVLYSINIDNNGDGKPDVSYQFTLRHQGPQRRTRSCTTPGRSSRSPTRTGTGGSPTRVRRVTKSGSKISSGRDLTCPPCNIGPLSTPNYPDARGGRGPLARRRPTGLRRPAGRGLLRRPRRDVRPARPASAGSNLHTTFGVAGHSRAQGRRRSTALDPSTCTASRSRCR